MADLPDVLKSMTVKSLRVLARKQIGDGYSKLKTKAQLVAALAKRVEASVAKALVAKLGEGRARPKPAPRVRALKKKLPRPLRKASVRAAKVKAAKPAGKVTAKATQTAKPTAKATSTAKATATQTPTPTAKPTPTPTPTATPKATPTPTPTAKAAPKAKPAPAPQYDEHLGELPDRYEDDSFIALSVNPTTLFLYWDFNRQTVASAASGLRHPRTLISLYADGQRLQEVEFALESRCFYLRGLAAGRSYHADIEFVGQDGRRQRVGRPSNAVGIPPVGPSPVVDDRFVAFPWEWKKGQGNLEGKLDDRPAPGKAQRDLAAPGGRQGAPSSAGAAGKWQPGGTLSGQPTR